MGMQGANVEFRLSAVLLSARSVGHLCMTLIASNYENGSGRVGAPLASRADLNTLNVVVLTVGRFDVWDRPGFTGLNWLAEQQADLARMPRP